MKNYVETFEFSNKESVNETEYSHIRAINIVCRRQFLPVARIESRDVSYVFAYSIGK